MGNQKAMSDTDGKPEDEISQTRDEAQDDGGDDEVREGPFRLSLHANCASGQRGNRKLD